jgi:hypothetical protein
VLHAVPGLPAESEPRLVASAADARRAESARHSVSGLGAATLVCRDAASRHAHLVRWVVRSPAFAAVEPAAELGPQGAAFARDDVLRRRQELVVPMAQDVCAAAERLLAHAVRRAVVPVAARQAVAVQRAVRRVASRGAHRGPAVDAEVVLAADRADEAAVLSVRQADVVAALAAGLRESSAREKPARRRMTQARRRRLAKTKSRWSRAESISSFSWNPFDVRTCPSAKFTACVRERIRHTMISRYR